MHFTLFPSSHYRPLLPPPTTAHRHRHHYHRQRRWSTILKSRPFTSTTVISVTKVQSLSPRCSACKCHIACCLVLFEGLHHNSWITKHSHWHTSLKYNPLSPSTSPSCPLLSVPLHCPPTTRTGTMSLMSWGWERLGLKQQAVYDYLLEWKGRNFEDAAII